MSAGPGKKSVKKNEANLPVRKSIRIRKEKIAPKKEEFG